MNLFGALLKGFSAKAEEQVRDRYAVELIEQKIRDAETGLAGAKQTLASLILRKRNEEKTLNNLKGRVKDLEKRAGAALDDGNEALALDAAEAIADIENEAAVRQSTLNELDARVTKTQNAVEKAHRRIVDLKQGLVSARAIDANRKAQRSLDHSLSGASAINDAEELIACITNADDPLDEAEVIDEINAGLTKTDVTERLAEAGYGDKTKSTGADVLARLKK